MAGTTAVQTRATRCRQRKGGGPSPRSSGRGCREATGEGRNLPGTLLSITERPDDPPLVMTREPIDVGGSWPIPTQAAVGQRRSDTRVPMKKQWATVCRSPLTSIHRSTTAIRRSTSVIATIDPSHSNEGHPTIHGSRRSIRRSTPVIRTIDQCHRVDRPQPFERSTGAITSIDTVDQTIDIIDQTIDTGHSNDRRRHGTRRPARRIERGRLS